MWKVTNLSTKKDEIWYSEQEYKSLENKYLICLKTLSKETEEKLGEKTNNEQI